MNKEPLDPRLEAYLALCQRMYERMRREGSWPWNGEENHTENDNNLDT
jgi:hypothetical protein